MKKVRSYEEEFADKRKKPTQVQAAELIKISQPKLSELLAGRFRGYSVERLIHFLTELGQDVDIVDRFRFIRIQKSVRGSARGARG